MFNLKIHLSTVFQFFQYLEQSVGSYENETLKYRKETNIFFYIMGCVYLDKNISDLWSISTSIISDGHIFKLRNHTVSC